MMRVTPPLADIRRGVFHARKRIVDSITGGSPRRRVFGTRIAAAGFQEAPISEPSVTCITAIFC